MEHFPETGKIQNNFFKARVFPYCGKPRHEVKIGPQFGVDVSVIQLTDGMAMAITSDPLSLIPTLGLRESAWLSVQLMANDMATTGFKPMYAQFVLNLPVTLAAEDFEYYWQCIHEYCEQLGVAITGGHTGRFDGLNSTVSGGGTMFTIAPYEEIITSKGAQPGDIIVLTKECALLSTAILALSFPETVKQHCGDRIYEMGCNLFYQTSAVEAGITAGAIARNNKGITAMHDVTEGGVIGSLYELANASECGVDVDESKIPVGEAQEAIGNIFNIDPKYCVGAGSMLITAKPQVVESLITNLEAKGIKATAIGNVTSPGKGITIKNGSEQKILTEAHTDPYWEAFFSAYQKGWK
ncbi:AIR synthase family protein [Chryseosolibacter indicus]|uniref:AIR synthase family protein n=1 Tax=Chryseosolibacter indicus TaxID=2782351 RepID=A0ABS5W2J3_9BACT|nr:AIR synthase family protein [Chryseosolibacter indicus]MBT1706486.1 AIR synthase family protein [Chryseosolibacter indicus]